MKGWINHHVGSIDADSPPVIRIQPEGPSARRWHDNSACHLNDVIISTSTRKGLVVPKIAITPGIKKVADRRHHDSLTGYIASIECRIGKLEAPELNGRMDIPHREPGNLQTITNPCFGTRPAKEPTEFCLRPT